MKRVVSLIHRQAVRAKAEGLFFNVRGYMWPHLPFVTELAQGLYTRFIQERDGSQEVPTERPALQGSRQPNTVFIAAVFQGRRRRPVHYRPREYLSLIDGGPKSLTNCVQRFRRYIRRTVVTGNSSQAGNLKRNSLRGREKLSQKSRLLKVTHGLRKWVLS